MANSYDPGVMDEAGWGRTPATLPPKERQAAKERKAQRLARWRKAAERRIHLSPEQLAEEDARIAAQIAAWERSHDAA